MGKSNDIIIENVRMNIPVVKYAMVTVSLPAVSLLFCFVTAYTFRFDDVNDTQCNVTNFIPSISAVTGITPQSYVWKICMALHTTPRFGVVIIYYNFYKSCIKAIKKEYVGVYSMLLHVNFWLNFVENAMLMSTAYVSNRDNYPVHEKLFILFMVTSLCYMLLNTILYRWSRPSDKLTSNESFSIKWKLIMFVLNFSATAGLLVAFYFHRLYCTPTAFSYFSLCEYVIAYTNMGYHITAVCDFKGMSILAAHFSPAQVNGAPHNNNIKKKQ